MELHLTVLLAILSLVSVRSFQLRRNDLNIHHNFKRIKVDATGNNYDSVEEAVSNNQRQRQQIRSTGSKIMISFLTAFNLVYASKGKYVEAKTFFDTDVYGDKELKIATVNKLKQKLRNAILKDNKLALEFLQLAINDALGFDLPSQNGGSDGSILYEMNRSENQPLMQALQEIQTVQKELQRTNTLSLADVVAFGGGEALESVGMGRVVVQIGRFDLKKENIKTTIVPWQLLQKGSSGSDIELARQQLCAAFEGAGLQLRDAAVLLATLGEIRRIITETEKQKKGGDDEDDEEFEEQPFVPVTFGRRDEIFGAKIGAADFGTKFLNSLFTKGATMNSDDVLYQVLAGDGKLKNILSKYVNNDTLFKKDIAEVYLKLTSIGEAYTTRNS